MSDWMANNSKPSPLFAQRAAAMLAALRGATQNTAQQYANQFERGGPLGLVAPGITERWNARGTVGSPIDALRLIMSGPEWANPNATSIAMATPTNRAGVVKNAAGEGPFFHGTSHPISGLAEDYYSGRNVYGEGLYATNDMGIGMKYRRKGSWQHSGVPKDPRLYTVQETSPVKLYDLDAPISPQAKAALEKAAGPDAVNPLGDALSAIESGEVKTLGEAMDHARSVSREYGYSADEVTDLFEGVSHNLRQHGFGGYTHVGGRLTGGRPHRVNIYWDPQERVALSERWRPQKGVVR